MIEIIGVTILKRLCMYEHDLKTTNAKPTFIDLEEDNGLWVKL